MVPVSADLLGAKRRLDNVLYAKERTGTARWLRIGIRQGLF